MQESYADNAVFNDEVFTNLTATEVRAMWEMFCINGKDLQIEFSNISAYTNTGRAEWIASYTFPTTGKKVVNHIVSNLLLKTEKL